jgi:hypothetical protein
MGFFLWIRGAVLAGQVSGFGTSSSSSGERCGPTSSCGGRSVHVGVSE